MGFIKRQPKSNSGKKAANKQFNLHLYLMFAGIICLILGFKFHQLFELAVFFELFGLSVLFKNWKRINEEYEKGKKNKTLTK
ncbi:MULTISPECIES: hypothetical protein [unclassified Clostridium]|uniref:hypothetical protein n=1 Tax=unclassified Clostridium TaxID=2614128 RepID=UPI0002978F75|nr:MULTISPECIES: hypothetical protein [unclassified Clostridium]EKQ56282.1 MAG: hypothetical protein A370_02038 [Clostridium sp. Maddingley MBC34-26]